VFADGYGTDTIKDYREGIDAIDLTGRTDVSSYAELEALMTEQNGDVHINFTNGDVLVIEHTKIQDLSAAQSDFLM
jgi:hypothetical protein